MVMDTPSMNGPFVWEGSDIKLSEQNEPLKKKRKKKSHELPDPGNGQVILKQTKMTSHTAIHILLRKRLCVPWLG